MPDLSARARTSGRETRARVAVGLEVRAAADGAELVSTGYSCTTDSPYEMQDWLGTYTEVVESGAFANVLASNPDVRLLVNHAGIPLARTTSGTLALEEHTSGVTTGLFHRATLDPASPLVQQVRSAMARSDLTEMSFMFTARADWSPDYEQRTIREITGLYDNAYVTFPANPGTSAQLNAAAAVGAIEARAANRVLGALRERRAFTPEETETLQHLLNLFVAADTAVDQGQVITAGLLGVPNPDADAPDQPAAQKNSAPLDVYRRRLLLAG